MPKSRKGRPPRYDAVGPIDFHLGLRFDRLRAAQIKTIVALEREKAKRAGKKWRDVTASALISGWIRERLDTETRRRGLVTTTARIAQRSLETPTFPRSLLRKLEEAQMSELKTRR